MYQDKLTFVVQVIRKEVTELSCEALGYSKVWEKRDG
jgi:hypothetical protein